MENNWLIVGLGNPGNRYEQTRHNLGFMLIDRLAREAQTQVKREECRSLIGRAVIENQRVELVKPQTYMNLSGEAIACLLKKQERSREKLIILVDDLALPLGSIRLRARGSDGGHNGLKSVYACLKTTDYIRLRMGIRPDHPVHDASRFVLDRFSKSDLEMVESMLERSTAAVETVLADGIDRAMARYNREEADFSNAK